MSLSTLKRKAGAKYSRISSSRHSTNGFSLNNPRRVESKSGKPQYQTPMKGAAYRGHGSTGTKYVLNVVKSQYTNSDPFVRDLEKTNSGISVKNNRASISSRNMWMKRGYPHYWVQPLTQNDYELYLRSKTSQISKSELGEETKTTTCNLSVMDNGMINPACKNKKSMDGEPITKRVDVMDQSEYIASKLMIRECLPPNPASYPPPVSRNSTFASIPNMTYEEYLETQEKKIADANACNE